MKFLPESDSTETDDIRPQNGDDEHKNNKRASLRWLVRRMCREARVEAAHSPKSNVKVRIPCWHMSDENVKLFQMSK